MTTMTATTMTMETKATVVAAAWQEHGVGGGGSAAAALAAAVWRRQRGGGGSGGGSAFEGCVGGRIGRVGGGVVAVLIELGRGVPRRVLQAVDVGRRAEGRESKGKDEGEGDVNGDGGSNSDEGEEGDDIGAIPFWMPERPSPPPPLSLLLLLTWRNRRLPSPTRINLEEP